VTSLAELQAGLFAFITDDARAGDPAPWVTGTPEMSAEARVDLYRQMYFARLFEVLATDYATLRGAVGEDTFTGLVASYLRAHPSIDASVDALGERFAAFLRSVDLGAELIDLARIDHARAMVLLEALDAPRPLADQGRVVPIAALRLVALEHEPVDVAVWKNADGVQHARLPPATAAVLRRAMTGATVAELGAAWPELRASGLVADVVAG